MKEQYSHIDSLIFIQLSSAANISDFKLSNAKLSVFIRRPKQASNNRNAISTKDISLHQNKCNIQEMVLAVCQRQDFLQIQFWEEAGKVDAYLKLPLEKLLDLPRVKHDIECLLVEKNWERFFQGPLRNVVQVNFSVISFSQAAGKLLISEAAVDLGADSSQLQIQWSGQVRSIKNRNPGQSSWASSEGIQFDANDLDKIVTFVVSAVNKDNELVGRKEIDVITTQMLLPQELPTEIEIILANNGKNVGKVTLHYTFIFDNV